MSDNYCDGCSKRWTLGWFAVQLVFIGAWIAEIGQRGNRR
jgi:hypothetical protein